MRSHSMMGILAMAALAAGPGISVNLVGEDGLGGEREPGDRSKPKPAIQPKASARPTPDTMTRQRRRAEERAAFKRLPAK